MYTCSRYAPPEVLTGGAVCGVAGDVFALALVIFETLALERCLAPLQRQLGDADSLPVVRVLAAVRVVVMVCVCDCVVVWLCGCVCVRECCA